MVLLSTHYSTKTFIVGTQKNHLNETGSFEHPKHMLKLKGKKKFTILGPTILFI